MPDNSPRLCRVAGRDTWHIYFRRRRISTGCTDRASAERQLAAFKAGLTRPTQVDASISGLLALHLADRTDAAIPGLDRLRWAHKPLTKFWGERPAFDVTAEECRRYARVRAKDGVATGTARTEMQALTAALRWAHRKRLLAEMPEIVLPPRAPPRERWLTRAEAVKLIDACAAHHVRLFVVLALHTAARKGAILALTWDRVDLAGRQIDFREPGRVQTRKGRSRVPINDTLLPELLRAKEGCISDHVVEWAGGPIASIKHGFRDACIRAGLREVMPHTLRHTAATWLAQGGISMWDIAGMLGHSSPKMVEETYGHHSPEHLRKAANVLG